jgi:hypothetical protein
MADDLPTRFVKNQMAPDGVGCALIVIILAVVVAVAFALDVGKGLDDDMDTPAGRLPKVDSVGAGE